MLRKWNTKFSCPFRSWLVRNLHTIVVCIANFSASKQLTLLSTSQIFKTLWVYLFIQNSTLLSASHVILQQVVGREMWKRSKRSVLGGWGHVVISVVMKFKKKNRERLFLRFSLRKRCHAKNCWKTWIWLAERKN